MQIYSDITGRSLKIASSSQTCAVGAAIFGAIAGGKEKGGYKGVYEAQKKTSRFKKVVYRPDINSKNVYDRIYSLYKDVHNVFGLKSVRINLYHVMKELLKIKDRVTNE